MSARDVLSVFDEKIARQAEAETVAQLEIIRVLKPLGRSTRQRIMDAARHLIDAEVCVPGTLDSFLRGSEGAE